MAGRLAAGAHQHRVGRLRLLLQTHAAQPPNNVSVDATQCGTVRVLVGVAIAPASVVVVIVVIVVRSRRRRVGEAGRLARLSLFRAPLTLTMQNQVVLRWQSYKSDVHHQVGEQHNLNIFREKTKTVKTKSPRETHTVCLFFDVGTMK